MKILYVGTRLAEAQDIATAVNSLGEQGTVSITSGLDRVASWIDENADPRLLVVEAERNTPVWRSVLTYTAGLTAALPVVVIVPEEIASDPQPLALDGHECVTRSPSLLQDLPGVITRAIDQARQRQLDRGVRVDLERKLAQATAAAAQLAKSQSQHEMGMARAAAMRDMANEQFREAAAEVERVRLRHASAVADAERLALRETELSVRLDSATKTQGDLERKLADAETALHASEARAADERRSLAGLVERRQREFEQKLSEEIDKRRGVEGTLAHALTTVTAAKQRQASATTAAAVQSRELQAALRAAGHELQSKAARLDAVTNRAAELEQKLDGQILQERAARAAHEEQIADFARRIEREASLRSELIDTHATALREERQRHDVALAAAVEELAERKAHFDAQLAEAEAKRSALTAQLRELEEHRDQARREHQSVVADIARLREREAELEGRLKKELETRDALEQQVARAVAALGDEQEQHRVALATATAELAGRAVRLREVEAARDHARREHQSVVADLARLTEREAVLEKGLKEERETRDVLEQEIAGAAAALRGAQERHQAVLATTAAEIAERQADYERERARGEAERADHAARLREAEEARDEARREHESALGDLTCAVQEAAVEREASTARETDFEAQISRLNEELDTLRITSVVQAAEFDEHRREHEIRLAKAHESLRLTQEDSRRLELAYTAATAELQQLTDERRDLEQTLDRLTREHAAISATHEKDIEQLRRQRDVLQSQADQLPGLQQELQKNRADNHRLFQQAPLPMFRCTKDGVLSQANRMLTNLLGRRSPDELRSAEWADAVFESPSDLTWLIERCVGSRGKESIESAWRGKDGSRLLVRLSACLTSSDLIEASVEDLTPMRVLNDRLTMAHRMEAVGRLATEVAVTCGGLLGSIHQNVQQLVVTDDGDSASRQRVEMLLDEISRATGLLRQLAAYGDEESRKPAMVDLSAVVRDVAPVLKRLAGDDVDVQVPAASEPLNVDAGAERVQRLLVNLAAFGRGRMPLGGRLKIELGRIVVDRHFAAKHPHVRLGPHALVTVTESRHVSRTARPLQLRDNEAGASSPSVAVQTGVDLGTLQELVAECGGHLWMTVEPAGDRVVKIRLPLVTSYGEQPRRKFAPGDRARALAHWFQR